MLDGLHTVLEIHELDDNDQLIEDLCECAWATNKGVDAAGVYICTSTSALKGRLAATRCICEPVGVLLQ